MVRCQSRRRGPVAGSGQPGGAVSPRPHRCLRRHGVGNLRDLQAQQARPKHSGFKACEPGCAHIDVKYLPQMADETSQRCLFVAIDRATRWVFIRKNERPWKEDCPAACARN